MACFGVLSGNSPRNAARPPDTAGVAIDVPDIVAVCAKYNSATILIMNGDDNDDRYGVGHPSRHRYPSAQTCRASCLKRQRHCTAGRKGGVLFLEKHPWPQIYAQCPKPIPHPSVLYSSHCTARLLLCLNTLPPTVLFSFILFSILFLDR